MTWTTVMSRPKRSTAPRCATARPRHNLDIVGTCPSLSPRGLDFLGFSSESSDINGLCGIFRESFFVRPALARQAGTGACGRGQSDGRDCSKTNYFDV